MRSSQDQFLWRESKSKWLSWWKCLNKIRILFRKRKGGKENGEKTITSSICTVASFWWWFLSDIEYLWHWNYRKSETPLLLYVYIYKCICNTHLLGVPIFYNALYNIKYPFCSNVCQLFPTARENRLLNKENVGRKETVIFWSWFSGWASWCSAIQQENNSWRGLWIKLAETQQF